ncbi:phosphonate ABC transporter, permease protein PhnE [Ruoffia sp. FAM 20857]|uniref:phosphonate ABC transporter, permease protein PhnE n=1 Tax=unclassified Ruoffia TaxID=2862149 RepID=UPI0038875845
MNNMINKQLEREPNRRVYYLTKFAILITLLIWSITGVQFKGIDSRGSTIARNIISGILSPDLDFLFEFSDEGVPYLLFETICITFLGTIFGSVLAIPVAFLMSQSIVGPVLSFITRTLLVIIRTIPSFVYGLMFIRVTGPGAYAGVLTMSITSIGMVSKLYLDTIEEIDDGILEAMEAAGCNTFEKIRYGVIPQLFTNFLSTTIYRFDMNLRDATVLGLVGAGGIGAPLIFAMNPYRWGEVGSILIGLIILILIIEFISTKSRDKLANG